MKVPFPQLAFPGSGNELKGRILEVKLDGVRILATLENSKTTLYSRRIQDYTNHFPEINLAEAFDCMSVVVDGEMVVLNEKGTPDFGSMQSRVHAGPKTALELSKSTPVIFYVFDLLELNGISTTTLSLYERKNLLKKIYKKNPCTKLVPSFPATPDMIQKIKDLGYEGVMLKDEKSIYHVGKRHTSWLKYKFVETETCVICGWIKKERPLGALVLGRYDHNGKLEFAGRVGNGWSEEDGKTFLNFFLNHVSANPLFQYPKRFSDERVNWVEPIVLVEVEFLSKNEDGFRFPIYKGVRLDLSINDLKKSAVA